MKFTPANKSLKLAEDKREKIAKAVFDGNRVAEIITKTAAAGEYGFQLAQECPLDLRATTYAKGLITKLKTAGYNT
ncbi:hypothetical protein [Cohaesibacter intestini]|uniref:hypothetical protein n=1 Tax=Cohaesibacter intestini TaxID=2211145 RepID=UPI000DE8324A|nr:hypothetical protein [Cohaesibacter intestini]